MPQRCGRRARTSHVDSEGGVELPSAVKPLVIQEGCINNVKQMQTRHDVVKDNSISHVKVKAGARKAQPSTFSNNNPYSLAPSKFENYTEPPQNCPQPVTIPTGVDDLTFYPAYAFKASPTYFVWVKLKICDIHNKLRHEGDYIHSWVVERSYVRDPPQLVFYQNHPIQFVQIIGVVVGFDEYFENFWLFTVDDSSGATIDVVCPKFKASDIQNEHDRTSNGEKERREDILRLSEQVSSGLVYIGAVLQVKGTITMFQRRRASEQGIIRNAKPNRAVCSTASHSEQEVSVYQITLDRLAAILDTSQEVALIKARNAFYATVLANPWRLTEQALGNLHRTALGEVNHRRKRARHLTLLQKEKCDQESRDADAILKAYAEEDLQRDRAAGEARTAGVVLQQLPPPPSNGPCTGHASIDTHRTSVSRNRDSARTSNLNGNDKTQFSPAIEKTQHNISTFAADDAEKFALLRAAFG